MSEAKPAIRQEVGDVIAAAAFGRLNWLREEPFSYDSLRDHANALIDLLADRKIDYVLVGGLAVMQFIEQRNTQDIDIVMAVADLKRLPELEVTYRDRDFIRSDFHGVTVDVLFTRNKLFDLVRKRFTTKGSFGTRTVPCGTPEGLVLMKLFALPSLYRQGQHRKIVLYEGDVRLLLEAHPMDTSELINLLRPHLLATDIVEIERIVRETLSDIDLVNSRPFGGPRQDDPHPP
jgi:hypothetical protein